MNKSATVHARVEPKTKKEAEGVLKKLGMSPTEAIRLFYNQICLRGGIPFPILIPNETTKKTLKKAVGVRRFNPLILLRKYLLAGRDEKRPNLVCLINHLFTIYSLFLLLYVSTRGYFFYLSLSAFICVQNFPVFL